MTKKVLALLCATLMASVFLCSCRTEPFLDPRISIDPALRGSLLVTEFIETTNKSGIKHIQFTCENQTFRTLQPEIRVDWFDATGLKQSSLTENWATISISRVAQEVFSASAPNREITNFKVYIQKKRVR